MAIKKFQYYAPRTIEEACAFLYDHSDEAKALAGGQSLIPLLKLNLVEMKYLVDLKRIPNLSFIAMEKTTANPSTSEDGVLEIGALTTHSEIEMSNLVRDVAPLLADTARGIGHPLVRNRGTIGGSLCHCDPAADYCATMLALNAEMVLASKGEKKRIVASKDFFKGTFETNLEKGELLEKIRVPISRKRRGYSIRKHTLGHGDFPLVVISVLLEMNQESKKCTSAAIALAGVGEKAFRVDDAERLLLEQASLGMSDFEEAAKLAADRSRPEADLEVSASYKRRMVQVLTRRALAEAFRRSSEES